MPTDDDERGDALREILAGSKRWGAAIQPLSFKAIVATEPVDLTGCSEGEALAIAAWARGSDTSGSAAMPARLARYIETVKEREAR